MKSINKLFLEKTFPLKNVQFAFSLKHIARGHLYKRYAKNPYEEELVLSVTDTKKFHQENFAMNKNHYPATSKFFKAKLVTFFSHYGAKVHVNSMPIQLEGGGQQYLRYVVVEHSDLIRDLRYWETLTISSMMLRPINVIYNDDWFKNNQEIHEAQIQNIKSALAFALILQNNQVTEKQLYRDILSIAKYQSKGLRLLETEDIDFVVDQQFEQLQEIYKDIIQDQEPFKSFVSYDHQFGTKNMIQKHESKDYLKQMLMELNDNVYQNLSLQISPRIYDPEVKYHKKTISEIKKEKKSDVLAEADPVSRKKLLRRSIEKILITHRNTKLFLFVMSGPFLILFMVLKYGFKVAMLYVLYKSGYLKKKNNH